MTATSYPTTPYASNANDYFDKDTKSLDTSISQAAGPSQHAERDERQVTAIPTSSSSNQPRNTHRRVAFFQHCAIIPDPPHLLQESKPSIQKRFSFATRSSNSNTSSSSSSHLNQTSSSSSSHKRNKSASSSSTATQSGFGSTLSSDQHKLGSASGSIKKSRRTSLDIGGGGGLRIGGGFSSNQEESQSGGKWRIKTLNKIGNVLAAATSNSNEPHSSEEESSHYIQDVDAEEYLSTVSFRDEIISKIAKGNNVVENCKLLEEFEKKKGNDKDEGEGTLKAKANGNHHQTTTAKRKKKKLKLKSALRPSSQFADSDYNSEQAEGLETSSSRESLALSDIQNETPEERIQRKSERANRLKRHDGQGPPIASLLSDSSTSASSPSPSSQLSTSSGKSLSISLYSGKEESEHIKAVEIARRLGGLVIPLETECSCKDCQAKIEIGLGDAYEPSWSKTARLKYIAGREQAKILARQRIDAAKRLAEKAEREEEMAVYHHGLGGNGSGPNPLIPSWASPNHLSPVGSRSSTPKITGEASEVEEESSDSSQKQKEIPLSTIALTRAAQITGEAGSELPRISSNNEASGDEAGLLAASNATGLKLELEDDRIDSNRTPEIEGPRPIRSSLDLARPSSKEDQEGDYFDSERLKPPTLRIPSSNLDSSSDQHSPYSDSASESGPSIIRPSPKRATGGSFSSSSPATSPITESRPTPLSPEAELPPLISNPIDDELVDELRALRLKAEEAARHRAASPRIRSGGGARAMMRQLEAAESRESLASIERTRSANSNRRNANISSDSHASSTSGWGGISPSPSPRGWDGPGIGRIGSPPIRAWSPAIDQNVATSPPTSPITRTLSPPFIHRATSPTISRSNSPSSPMMRSSLLGRVSSIPEPNGAHDPSLLHLQQGNESHSPGGHSLLRTCQDAADNEVQTRPPLIIQRPKARPASAVQDADNPPAQENLKEEIVQTDSSSLPSVSVTYPTLDKAPPALAAALELKEELKKEESKPFPISSPSSKQGEVLSKADQLPPQRHQRSKSSSSISSSSYQTHALVAAFGSPITSVGSMDNVNNSPRLQRTASSSERHKNQVQRPKPSRAYSSQNKISKTDPPPASTSSPNTYIPSQSGASSSSTSNDISKAAKKGLSFIKNLI